MVQRFHDQVFQKMSPEKRARKLSVMRALAQGSMRIKNKENEDPLNNNKALPFNFKHSTPLKSQQQQQQQQGTANLESIPSQVEIKSIEAEIYLMDESNSNEIQIFAEETKPDLFVAKIYDLMENTAEISKRDGQEEKKKNFNLEVKNNPSGGGGGSCGLKPLKKRESMSSNSLNETAEYEFCRGLDQSKLFLSTSNLLEEIEADLPPKYSLSKPFNHTFQTLTSYRTVKRLARMEKNATCENDSNDEGGIPEDHSPSEKLGTLEIEAMVQKAKAQQAEKALALSKTKKSMETEILESEKTLLLAKLRFKAAIQEIEKLSLFGDKNSLNEENFGQITITSAIFALDALSKYNTETFICTATEGENVQYSCILNKTANGKLHFDKSMMFQNLNKNFVIYVELYRRLDREAKVPIKTCIMKKLKELASVTLHKSITNNSSNHRFSCVAYAELRLENITKRENEKCVLYFIESPQYPIKGETLMLHVKTDFNIKSKKSGFLNVFKRTWHRQWYSQSGYFLNCWHYPEDQENEKPPIDSIYLPACLEKVKPADFEVCIRPNSFVLASGPKKEEILFSADSNADMIKWINHLNLIIKHIQLWKPNI